MNALQVAQTAPKRYAIVVCRKLGCGEQASYELLTSFANRDTALRMFEYAKRREHAEVIGLVDTKNISLTLEQTTTAKLTCAMDNGETQEPLGTEISL